ncbi:MAG: NAD(P)-binding domain-containing protein [Clostridiales bacterium]|nr:NAD(P)-binding domain-containing protein [Clostridiales bacterium]
MKAAVIQERIIQTDITPAELTARWKGLERVPGVDEVRILAEDHYPSRKSLDAFIGDAEALFGVWIGPDLINEPFLDSHPRLKYIATLGHGWETFDAEMTRRRGIVITNTVYGSHTIAEYAFALLMNSCHHIALHDARVKTIDWTRPENKPEFCKSVTRQIELYGKTLGIMGLGAIGFSLARMAQGFGMHVISYDLIKRTAPEYGFIEQADTMEELLSRSDFISLHMPHTPKTERMINAEIIEKMKDGVVLINTARGALIDEQALADALASGKVGAACLDVLTEEPPRHGSPLLTAPNCTITGHVAWLTRESRLRAVDMAIENFVAYLSGAPKSVINK